MSRKLMILATLAVVGTAELLVMIASHYLGIQAGWLATLVDTAVLIAVIAPLLHQVLLRRDKMLEEKTTALTAGIAEHHRMGEVLRQQLRMNDAVFNESVSCFVLLDPHFNFIRVNEAYAKTCGRKVEDFPGCNHFDFYPSDAKLIFEEVVRTKKLFQTQARPFTFADQPERGVTYWDWTLVPILDEKGEVEFLVFSLNEVTKHKRAREEIASRARQMLEVVKLGQRALEGSDLDTLMAEAVSAVANTLGVEHCRVLELLPDGLKLVLREGVGWQEGVVGVTIVGAGMESQAGYTLQSGQPVIVDDLRTETRFRAAPLLVDHGVISSLSVVIQGQEKPFGVLGAHTTQRRTFTSEDANFLQLVSDVLAAAIQRKQAEDAVRASEGKYRQIVETTNEGIWLLDPDGKTIFANRQAAQMLGCSQKELSRLSLYDFTYDSDLPDVRARREQRRMEVGGAALHRDIRHRRKDGSKLWGHVSIAPMFEETGKYAGTMGMLTDVTERKLAEEQLRQNEESFRLLFTRNPLPMWLWDSETLQFLEVNEAAIAYYGYSREEFLKMRITDIRPPEDVPIFLERLRSPRSSVRRRTGSRHLLKDGRLIDVATNSHTLEWKGRKAILVAIEDITDRKRAQEALRESEKKYRQIVETANEGIWLVDPGGKIMFANRQMAKMLGCSVEELSGLSVFTFFYDSDLPDVRARMKDYQKEVSSYSERRLRCKNGSELWALVSVVPIYDETGKYAGNLGMITDITERKRAEDALRSSEAQLQKVLHNIHEVIFAIKIDGKVQGRPGGTPELISPAARDIFGCEPEELLRDPGLWFRLIHPEDVAGIIEGFDRVHIERKPYQQIYRIWHKIKGEYRWIENSSFAEFDASGKLVGAFGVGRDVTERKLVADKLRDSEARLKEAQRLAQLGYWDRDIDTGVVSWSEELYRMFGRDPSLPALSLQEQRAFFTEESWLLLQPAIEQAVSSGKPWELELEIIRGDGEPRWFISRGQEIRNATGRVVRLSGTGLDITERKRAQEERQHSLVQLRALAARMQTVREDERTRVAREIHDDLGSELTSLKWDAETLGETLSAGVNESQFAAVREKLETIVKRIDATFGIARRIASDLRPSMLDDLGLVEAIEWQAQQFQARTGIPCNVDCVLEKIVPLNREQSTAFFRIFQEALTNILRHAEATKVDVTIVDDGGEFVLTISDNGRGITEDEKSGRLSLGLLGMQERAHLLGGTIDITSAAGKGTVITARIPIPS